MPPRRKPTSTRKKKADIQLKRAVKRGDLPPPDPKKPIHHRKHKSLRIGPAGQLLSSATNPSAAVNSSRRLQSAFITLPPRFLEVTRSLASNLTFPRPLPHDAAVFIDVSDHGTDSKLEHLSCPRRPKWRFDMTKKEVEKNEEGVFKKWLDQMDQLVEEWQKADESQDVGETESENEEHIPKPVLTMPRSPTYFERNLEVWRQLWRVTEISQIILVLLDSRCPLLHFPPSLSAYLSDRKVILVLTKVDISGYDRAEAWTAYFRKHYPGLRVVQVESYVEKEARSGHQGRRQYEPHLPQGFRERLVDAVREVHAEMLQPPEKMKGNEARMKRWKPPVKLDVNWEAVLRAGGTKVGTMVGGTAAPRPKDESEVVDGQHQDQEPEFLTIGLIGQPNVGKSSLLNALFGTHKVRASKTPGKTKHFQTLFWTPDVRLVDCPGLVMPNFVPMEMQVLAGILPISRVAAIPSCIHHAAQYLPLERIFNLTHPALTAPPVQDKRTWRNGVRPVAGKEKAALWTAMDVLTAYANAKGWVTAKAGRPDVHRAGNAILRAVAEGKVAWAFWPPGTDPATLVVEGELGTGIWIPHVEVVDDESEEDSDQEEEGEEGEDEVLESEEEEAEEDEEEESGEEVRVGSVGRFGALLDDVEDEDEESEEG